jgi:hypothetical protein
MFHDRITTYRRCVTTRYIVFTVLLDQLAIQRRHFPFHRQSSLISRIHFWFNRILGALMFPIGLVMIWPDIFTSRIMFMTTAFLHRRIFFKNSQLRSHGSSRHRLATEFFSWNRSKLAGFHGRPPLRLSS